MKDPMSVERTVWATREVDKMVDGMRDEDITSLRHLLVWVKREVRDGDVDAEIDKILGLGIGKRAGIEGKAGEVVERLAGMLEGGWGMPGGWVEEERWAW